ncbi:3-hydroxyacyl-CoA dehydrogenase family protein [Caulobacter segnis]
MIAASTSRPESVIFPHFFSPANVMRLLEVVAQAGPRPPKTRDRHPAHDRHASTGKVPVLGRRRATASSATACWPSARREANRPILEGATPRDVDPGDPADFGLPMGPFAMSDLGRRLDIGWDPAETNKSAYRPRPALRDAGTPPRPEDRQAGFSRLRRANLHPPYASRPSPRRSSATCRREAPGRAAPRDASSTRRSWSAALYPMVNEGAKILEEGKAIGRPTSISSINGYGWPGLSRRAGCSGAAPVGLDKILAKMKEFQAAYGDDFKPSALLGRLVASRARGSRTFKAVPTHCHPGRSVAEDRGQVRQLPAVPGIGALRACPGY